MYWWSEHIATLRKQCISCKRSYQRKRKKRNEWECTTEAEKYKLSRKNLVQAIKIAKEKCWMDLCREVDNDPWGRPYKIVTKKLMKRQAIIGIEISGRLENIVSRLFPRDITDHSRASQISGRAGRTSFPEITEKETLEEVNRLPHYRTPGPDGVVNEFLKVIIRADSRRITKLFNRCLWEAHYPEQWKTSNLVLIQKPRRPPDGPSSYQPLCLLDTLGKLFEKILARRLTHYLEATEALENAQYGFRGKKSTIDAIRKLQTIVEDNNVKGRVVGMLALDMSNTFNSAPWSKLTHALREMDVPKYLQDIVGAYLSNRKVVYNLRGDAKEFTVERVVPQGSVLGPCLWNVMLLQLPLQRGVEIIAFADDVAIVTTAEHSIMLEGKLKNAFTQVSDWMQDNGLTLAEHKTEAIVFTRRYTRNKMTVRCGETLVESVGSLRYLGLTMDQKMKFTEHANKTSKKVAETVRKLGYILPNLGG